jgi:hypothetical protein
MVTGMVPMTLTLPQWMPHGGAFAPRIGAASNRWLRHRSHPTSNDRPTLCHAWRAWPKPTHEDPPLAVVEPAEHPLHGFQLAAAVAFVLLLIATRSQAGLSVTRGSVARPSRSIDYFHGSF